MDPREEPPAPLVLSLEFVRAQRSDDAFAFDATPQSYLVRGGAGTPTIRIAWDDALRADLAALARRGCDPAVVQRVGDLLRALLLPAGWDRHAEAIAAAIAAGREVRLALRPSAAELYALPWELLTLEAGGRHLGELPGVLIQYTWPIDHVPAGPAARRPEGGRILYAWSAAGGGVPAAAHLQEIAAAAAEGHFAFDPERDVLKNASLAGLAEVLRAAEAAGAPVSVLHLLCHGGRRGASVGLWLDGEAGPVLADAGDLRRALPRLPLVVLAACSASDPGELGNHLGSVAQALHRDGCDAVVSSRFPLSVPGSVVLTRRLYRGLLVELRSVEAALQRARAALADDPSALDWAGLQLYARSDEVGDTWPIVVRPYRGLLAFHPEHARLFFGREQKIAELCSDLAGLRAAGKARMLVVAGASGSGKSSLVMAGVLPRLLAELGAELVRMVPGQNPASTLEAGLARRARPAGPCLIVVDQLEEIFTLLPGERAGERQTFVRALWRHASDPDGKISVIATLRIDFIGACGDITLDEQGARLDQVACDKDFGTLVAQMNPDELRDAIERPAAALGLRFDPGLVDQILAELGDSPVSLPLLGFTLDKLWEQREGRSLTRAAYGAMGGVTGALQSHAEALLRGLDEVALRLTRKLFTRMVTVVGGSRTRRRVREVDLRPKDPALAPRFESVVAALVDARLLVRGRDSGEATLELAHEALIHRWQTLDTWLHDDAALLAGLAELQGYVLQWQRDGNVLVGPPLDRARELQARYPEELERDMLALLSASEAALALRQRRRRRIFLGTIVAAVLLAVSAVIAGISAYLARRAEDLAAERARIAEDASREAAAAARRAREAVMLSAARLATRDPAARALLLRDLTSAGTLRGWLAAAVALVDEGPPPRVLAEHHEAIRVLAFSADGRWLASGSDDLVVRLTPLDPGARADAADEDPPDALSIDDLAALASPRAGPPGAGAAPVTLLHTAHILDLALDADASRVVTLASDRVVRLWRRDAPRSPLTLEDPPPQTARVALSPDGAWVAAAGVRDPVVWRSDGTGGARRLRCPPPPRGAAPPEAPPSLAWSPDSLRLAAPCPGAVGVWRLAAPEVPLLLPFAEDDVPSGLAFAPDGTSLAARTARDLVTQWRLDPAPTRLTRLVSVDAGFLAGALAGLAPADVEVGAPRLALRSPEGLRLLVITDAGDAAVVTRKGSVLRRLPSPPIDLPPEGAAVPFAWRPDGRALAVAGRDNTIRLWSVERDDPPVWQDPDDPVQDGAFHPRLDQVLLRRQDRLQIFALGATGAALLREWPSAHVAAAWDPEGSRVAALQASGELVLWTPEDELHEALSLPQPVAGPLVWSPASSGLAARSTDQSLAWVWRRGEAPLALPCALDPAAAPSLVEVAEFSRDGELLALGCSDGVTLLYPLAGGPPVALPTRDGAVLDLDWSPDDRALAVAYAGKVGRVWRRDGRGDPRVLRGHSDRVSSIHWNPDGAGLVTTSYDNTGRVWFVDDDRILPGEGHSDGVVAASLQTTPEGNRALSVSLDQSARIWSLGDEPIVLGKFRGGLVSAAWSADGRRVLTVDRAGAARIHLVSHDLVQAWLRRHAEGCLSPQAREKLLGETPDAAGAAYRECLVAGVH